MFSISLNVLKHFQFLFNETHGKNGGNDTTDDEAEPLYD